MTKIIDGKNAALGRLASFAAKESLKGENIVVVNCNDVIITGNEKQIKEKFEQSKRRVGSGQKGPKISRAAHMIVKRAIRGMLPNYRRGRGRVAFKRILCFADMPKEFESKEKIKMEKTTVKKIKVRNLLNGK